MRRVIQSSDGAAPRPLEKLQAAPDDVGILLDPQVNRCDVRACVTENDHLNAGEVIAQGDHISIHASVTGIVRVEDTLLRIVSDPEQTNPDISAYEKQSRDTLPRFAAEMGLVGMGGSMFPSSIKLAAAKEVHTLVINAVECEPGIEIDECLLLHDGAPVKAAVEMLQDVLTMEQVILATKRASVAHVKAALPTPGTKIHAMSNSYPAGAEKLIVDSLDHRMPPAGELPVHRGYLVISVASLWAIGRRLLEGRPSIDRPLTVINQDTPPTNLIVPVGTSVQHLLNTLGITYNENEHILVAGGLMMGRRVTPEFRIQKGTNALFVHPVTARLRKPEEPCILCGSCFDACPLNLHPTGMADRIKDRQHSAALEAHVQQCFLCGACSAVCPSEIPLVQYFHEGKRWLRERT